MSFLMHFGTTPTGPAVSVNPTSINFGAVDVASGSSSRIVTVTNVGDDDLVIGTLAVTGAGFGLSANGLSGQTLAPSQSGTVSVDFDPSLVIGYSGVLSIPSDAPTTPNTIALSGTGIVAGDDFAWVTALRAEFNAITYSDVVMPPGTYSGAQLQAAIASAGSGSSQFAYKRVICRGSTVTLGASGTASGINFTNRAYMELDLTGTNIVWSALPNVPNGADDSALFFRNSHHIRIVGGSFMGANTAAGTSFATPAFRDESLNAAAIRAFCHHIEFDGVSWDRICGFGIFTASQDGGVGDWPYDIWLHGCYLRGAQQTLALVSQRRYLFEDSMIEDDDGTPIDFEPDLVGHGSEDVLIQGNEFRRFGWATTGTSWWMAANANNAIPLASMPGIINLRTTVRDNWIPEGHQSHFNSQYGGILIRCNKANPKTDMTITGNVSDDDSVHPNSGSIFNATVNLVLTGNRQAIYNSGPLYSHEPDLDDVPCINPTVTPNDTAV